MTATQNSLLHIITLIDLDSWSVQSLLDTNVAYNKKYPLEKIGAFLIKSREVIDIEDEVTYNRVTVKVRNGGVTLRDVEKGSNIGTKKQYRVKTGQFIVSKIDARNGSFGIIPNDLEGAVVTNDFPVFEVDNTKILTEFLLLITTTKEFIKFAQSCSSGTTNRQRMDIDMFLNQRIPLPSLPEQEAIVNAYQQKIQQAQQLEQEANDLEGEIERYLFEELGVAFTKTKKVKTAFSLVNFKDTDRWDTLFLLGNIPSLKSKFSLVKFADIIACFNKSHSNKTIRIDSFKFPDNDFKYIGMENIEKETGILLEIQDVKGAEIKSQTLRVPENFIIYGKLRPYLNKYWINNTAFENVICSSEFFVFDIVSDLDKNYFKSVLASEIVQNQISDKTSGARMPRINEDIFLNLEMPLPPIEIQESISESIEGFRQKQIQLKTQANELVKNALNDFEKEIFGK